MKLINLSSDETSYSINDDGTLIIKINDEYMLKISWAEIRSIDMIISDQQSEALGMAKKVIEKIKKRLDASPQTVKTPSSNPEEIFDKKTIDKFNSFLESYLNKVDTNDVFLAEDIRKVLGQEFLIAELEEVFGKKYAFKELEDEKVFIQLKE